MTRRRCGKWLTTLTALLLALLILVGSPLTPSVSFVHGIARYDVVVQRGLLLLMETTSGSSVEEARGGRFRWREPGIPIAWRSLLWWPHAWFIGWTGFSQFCVPIWPFAAAASGAALLLWRLDRRARPGLCLACGYDLRGNVSGRCPECGRVLRIPTVKSDC